MVRVSGLCPAAVVVVPPLVRRVSTFALADPPSSEVEPKMCVIPPRSGDVGTRRDCWVARTALARGRVRPSAPWAGVEGKATGGPSVRLQQGALDPSKTGQGALYQRHGHPDRHRRGGRQSVDRAPTTLLGPSELQAMELPRSRWSLQDGPRQVASSEEKTRDVITAAGVNLTGSGCGPSIGIPARARPSCPSLLVPRGYPVWPSRPP